MYVRFLTIEKVKMQLIYHRHFLIQNDYTEGSGFILSRYELQKCSLFPTAYIL